MKLIQALTIVLTIVLLSNNGIALPVSFTPPTTSVTVPYDPKIPGSSIRAEFRNRYDQDLTFIKCIVIGGRQIGVPADVLRVNETEQLHFDELSPNVQQVTGNCYYHVPVKPGINGTDHVVLDIIFYRSTYWGQEWYGMTNDPAYKVYINIITSGQVVYWIHGIE